MGIRSIFSEYIANCDYKQISSAEAFVMNHTYSIVVSDKNIYLYHDISYTQSTSYSSPDSIASTLFKLILQFYFIPQYTLLKPPELLPCANTETGFKDLLFSGKLVKEVLLDNNIEDFMLEIDATEIWLFFKLMQLSFRFYLLWMELEFRVTLNFFLIAKPRYILL